MGMGLWNARLCTRPLLLMDSLYVGLRTCLAVSSSFSSQPTHLQVTDIDDNTTCNISETKPTHNGMGYEGPSLALFLSYSCLVSHIFHNEAGNAFKPLI